MLVRMAERKGFYGIEGYFDISDTIADYVEQVKDEKECAVFANGKIFLKCNSIVKVNRIINLAAEKVHISLRTFYIAPSEQHGGYVARAHPQKKEILLVPTKDFDPLKPRNIIIYTYILDPALLGAMEKRQFRDDIEIPGMPLPQKKYEAMYKEMHEHMKKQARYQPNTQPNNQPRYQTRYQRAYAK